MDKNQKETFGEINKNWEDKINAADDLLVAVGRSKDSATLKVISEDISSKLDLNSDDYLLEVGSGTGVLLSELSKKSKLVNGVDYSTEAVKRGKKAFPDIEMQVAEADNLPFDDNQFDKLLCYGVFHYFVDTKYALSAIDEFLRVCRKGGTILIGDLPSKRHFHLSQHYKKSSIFNLPKIILKEIIRIIKRRPKVKKAPIIDVSKWLWFDLIEIRDELRVKGYTVDILECPNIIQWREISHTHRFDLRIRK